MFPISSEKVTLKENIQEINTALKMARGLPILQPDTCDQKIKSDKKWNNLYSPEVQVDDTFMSTKRKVVTVHDDGQVSIEPTDPAVMNKMLQKYSQSPPPDSPISSPSPGNFYSPL